MQFMHKPRASFDKMSETHTLISNLMSRHARKETLLSDNINVKKGKL